MLCHRKDISRESPDAAATDGPRRSKTLKLMNEWRRASQVPVAGKCMLRGGVHCGRGKAVGLPIRSVKQLLDNRKDITLVNFTNQICDTPKHL